MRFLAKENGRRLLNFVWWSTKVKRKVSKSLFKKYFKKKTMLIYTKFSVDPIKTNSAIVVELDHEICYKHI